MIDCTRCMARRDGEPLFTFNRCQEPATHVSYTGARLCARHAEDLRQAMRNPNTLINILAGDRARTEEEIALLVRELPS